jgi:N-acetyltransferase
MFFSDTAALVDAANDGELWKLKVTVVPGAESINRYILADSGKVIGSTRFWNMDAVNRSLEIGHTWIGKSWQRSFVNTECKYLLLRFALEELRCIRVQFTTDELNEHSRAAILRLGAVEEGVIRHERIMPDGRKRNSVRYSIIDAEWPAIRSRLEEKLRAMNSEPSYSFTTIA